MAKGFFFGTQEDALEMEIIEQTETRLIFNVTRCRYADIYRDLGIPELGVLLSCNRSPASLEGFNPRLKVTRAKAIMEGADFCDFRYETKKVNSLRAKGREDRFKTYAADERALTL